ncbi:MAG: hypothetical protein ACLFNZ_10385 [Spirochaetaceae bacterium]
MVKIMFYKAIYRINPERITGRILPVSCKENEEKYAEYFAEQELGGIAAKQFGMALGALLMKEKLGDIDRE